MFLSFSFSENYSKKLRSLYSSISMLKKEAVEKSKQIVSKSEISNDIATVSSPLYLGTPRIITRISNRYY